MASLVLGIAGTAVGPSLFGGGISIFGASISGAQIGGALGALAGAQIDAALMPAVKRSGPRLSDIALQTSTEGAPIPRVFGRARLAGQLIWASRFKETATTTGGKGLASPPVEVTDYAYSISFAVGLCAGPLAAIGRVWADGNPLDLTRYTLRFHSGGEDEAADPLIAEIEGVTPAYRGLAYVVFEDMPLAEFGNRIPQLQFEVVRALASGDPAALENRLTAVALIPGAGEFVYAPDIVTDCIAPGVTRPLNAASGRSDFETSLDDLAALAPNLGAVSLVVGWFGDDLRAGACRLRPGVESAVRVTYPEGWRVADTARADAHVVSRIDGRPAYGGTPSDDSVKAALAALKARGLKVTVCPFVFLDIPAGNALPNPYTDNAAGLGQPAHPWRGRITVSPALGFAGSPDRTAAAAAQVAAFFAQYRAMVLHDARLCAEAGGVDAFLIGSELVGLTRVRSGAADYPAVAALRSLAAEVRAILPAARIGYAADWSEYAGHQTGDGALLFNLDPLWADPAIDFVGIDNYLPLADWRDDGGRDAAEFSSPCDPAYLAANIRGGEYYDWYYADAAARAAQQRTPITDGLGKPWVWRAKDLWGWWANRHFDRPDGCESAAPTAWVPQSKPIRFCELGCPAVDKGANQPNLFPDAKSSESGLPYFSRGERDDRMQRRFLEAHLAYWREAANNPPSALTGLPMVEPDIFVWCWDARPYPYFPARADLWGDAANWRTGHWLNGRLGVVELPRLVAALCDVDCDVSGLEGLVAGYAVTDTMSARDALGPLMAACFFDGVESEGRIKFLMRGRDPVVRLGENDLVLGTDGAAFALERAQETDLPCASRVTYSDAAADYRPAVTQARRLVSWSDRVATSSLPLVLDQAQAAAIGERLLQDAWVMRERATFSLPPSLLALDPCDEIELAVGGRTRRLRLTGIDDAGARRVEAVATDPSIYDALDGPDRVAPLTELRRPGRAALVLLDLPLLTDAQDPYLPLAAAYADPWPGTVAVLKDTGAGTAPAASLKRPARFGTTLWDFWSGPLWRWDRVNTLAVRLDGALSSADDAAVFAGANALAVENPDGDWEIVQFAEAALVAPGEWRLTKLRRGRRGSEHAMRNPVPAGARVVVLDAALVPLALSRDEASRPVTYIYGPAGLPVTDPAFQSVTHRARGTGLVPFAPCHVRHAWQADGSLVITWRRRDRAPAAASLAVLPTPMSETRESYDLEILDGAAVVRTFADIAQPSQRYTAAEQAADFPAGLPNPLIVRVCQRSSAVGRGRQKTESLYVR